jgi:two-component system chemotaxis response regulator CheB
MLSSYTKEGADLTLKALELGAIDFISKPSSIFKVNTEDVIKELVEKIEIASKVKPKKNVFHGYEKKPSERTISTVSTVEKFKKTSISDSEGKISNIIAIGTSTGGPKALQEVLPKFPANISASIIVVQHMPPKFTKSLAERLNTLSNINVKEAEDGEILTPGWAYIAPGDKHLHLQYKGLKYYISLSDGPLVSGHKPSVDSMFYSVADTKLKNIISVIMTGMGADGAKGLVRIKNENNGYIIAQNEESCIVFGMPKSAIAENVVDKVCDLSQITSEIMKAMGV